MALSKLVRENSESRHSTLRKNPDNGRQETHLLHVLSLTDFGSVVFTLVSLFKTKRVPNNQKQLKTTTLPVKVACDSCSSPFKVIFVKLCLLTVHIERT